MIHTNDNDKFQTTMKHWRGHRLITTTTRFATLLYCTMDSPAGNAHMAAQSLTVRRVLWADAIQIQANGLRQMHNYEMM